MTLFILIVVIIALLFLVINLIFAPHNPYQEKYSIFECGFHSFLGQNRMQFGVKFFIFSLVYLLLDLEILLTYPFAVSEYTNDIYGLMVTLAFIGIITIGFVFELGKGALKIDSRQILTKVNAKPFKNTVFSGGINISYPFTIKRDYHYSSKAAPAFKYNKATQCWKVSLPLQSSVDNSLDFLFFRVTKIFIVE